MHITVKTYLFIIPLLLAIVYSVLLYSPLVSFAQTGPLINTIEGPNNKDKCATKGDCELKQILEFFVKLTKVLFSLSGSLALGFFIYGGFYLMLSGGSPDRITKGKKIIINAIIGLLIMFSSFMIVDYALKKIGYECKNWYQFGGDCVRQGDDIIEE